MTFSSTTTLEDRVVAANAIGATIGHNLYRWNQLAITERQSAAMKCGNGSKLSAVR